MRERGRQWSSLGQNLKPEFNVTTGRRRIKKHQLNPLRLLDFVETAWSDGVTIDRQFISTTDLPLFGKKACRIPFDASEKKWVRVAAWDSAGRHAGSGVAPGARAA